MTSAKIVISRNHYIILAVLKADFSLLSECRKTIYINNSVKITYEIAK